MSRALAKKRTKWRIGDDGFFACADCASLGLPCFTWVRDEDEEEEGGEFWCLPVHGGDRYLPLVKGKEIRRWINEAREEDDGEDDDSSASEVGGGGFGDNGAFVPSESEDGGNEEDDDEDEAESEYGDDDGDDCNEEE